jgi:hypothetical protein
MIAMMISLQRRLDTGSDEGRERQFYTHTLQCLTTTSGQHVEMEEWMVASLEVEFGHKIGSGGLYVFFRSYAIAHSLIWHYISGQVFKGTWNKTKVALKVLTVDDGVAPSSTVRFRNCNLDRFLRYLLGLCSRFVTRSR